MFYEVFSLEHVQFDAPTPFLIVICMDVCVCIHFSNQNAEKLWVDAPT